MSPGGAPDNDPGSDPVQHDHWIERINQRWGQLHQLEKEWGERAFAYLMVTNAGGAIATLSFLGASDRALQLAGVKWALVLFVLGIVLVGVNIAKTYHDFSRLYRGWNQDAKVFLEGKITWEHLHERDNARSPDRFWDYVLGYAAFLCFISGSLIGGVSLFF